MANETPAFANAEDEDESLGVTTEPSKEEKPPAVTEEIIEAVEEDDRIAHEEEPEKGEEDKQPEERQKITSKERRARRKVAQDRVRYENTHLRQEVQGLMQRLAQLETGAGDTRLAVLDSEIKRWSDQVALAEDITGKAISAQNGVDAMQAQRLRDEARDQLSQLQSDRTALSNAIAQARSLPPPTLPNPGSAIATQYETQFVAAHPWLQFDTRGTPQNIESGVAKSLTGAILAQGFKPDTPKYWAELEKRMKAAMPNMYQDGAAADDEDDEDFDDDEGGDPAPQTQSQQARQPVEKAPRDRGPPVGKGRNSGGGNRTTTVPKDVVAALKDAGMWDDPKERAEALEYYRAAGTIK